MFCVLGTNDKVIFPRTLNTELSRMSNISLNTNSPFHWYMNSDGQDLPNVFSWELNNPKDLVVEEVGGANFHGFIFLWVREDEILVNFKLDNHKDD